MKYVDEYRNHEQVQTLAEAIRQTVTRPWHIMEICGGQTHALARYRLEEMLPPEIRLLHGPGCPVCVTPVSTIDYALQLAALPDCIVATFGDMMRVPGSREDLLHIKAKGGDIRMLYSPLDAVTLAENHPDKRVVFFAIGFETTAPVHLLALKEAIRKKVGNFFLLTALFAVPPAIETILSDPGSKVDGFLTAGHVCAITGNTPYRRLAKHYKTPMVVTGFEPVDLLYGIYRCLLQLEAGETEVENAYKRAVPENGNPAALKLMEEMLEPCDQTWRGMGTLPLSGFRLRQTFQAYDATRLLQDCDTPHLIKQVPVFSPEREYRHSTKTISRKTFTVHCKSYENKNENNNNTGKNSTPSEVSPCIAGDILRGLKQPVDCPLFGTHCQPDHPEGAPMVSPEGVCAAYYRYK